MLSILVCEKKVNEAPLGVITFMELKLFIVILLFLSITILMMIAQFSNIPNLNSWNT